MDPIKIEDVTVKVKGNRARVTGGKYLVGNNVISFEGQGIRFPEDITTKAAKTAFVADHLEAQVQRHLDRESERAERAAAETAEEDALEAATETTVTLNFSAPA